MPPRDITGSTSAVEDFKRKFARVYQRNLDKTVPHRALRWAMFGFLLLLYFIRVFHHGGFYVITYGMSIHLLYFVLMLITPLADERYDSDPTLPRTNAASEEEFRPFVPQLQEFIVWKSMFRVVLICLFLSMFNFLDIPVFWPLLLLYFIMITVSQMGGRIKHMMKHRYVPWNAGKPKYVAKTAP